MAEVLSAGAGTADCGVEFAAEGGFGCAAAEVECPAAAGQA